MTVPKPIREQFGLTPETEVDFIVRDGRLELAQRKGSAQARVDEIYGYKRFDQSTDDLMKLLWRSMGSDSIDLI